MRSNQGLPQNKGRPSTSTASLNEMYQVYPRHQIHSGWSRLSTDELQPQTQAQEMRDLFAMLDKDGDGVVTQSDLRAMLNSLGHPSQSQNLIC